MPQNNRGDSTERIDPICQEMELRLTVRVKRYVVGGPFGSPSAHPEDVWTSADRRHKRGARARRVKPDDDERDGEEVASRSSWRPADDVFGDGRKMSPTVDTDLDFEGRFGK
jgi:hypothetical protein